MKNSMQLPEGYTEIFTLDLQKNKKTAWLVNILALLLAVPMVIIGAILVPFTTFLDFSDGHLPVFWKIIVLLAGFILYMVLHELVHGICMKHFSKAKVHDGFTGLYAYAGSDACFHKKAYIIIALAPVVVWKSFCLLSNALSARRGSGACISFRSAIFPVLLGMYMSPIDF